MKMDNVSYEPLFQLLDNFIIIVIISCDRNS